MCFWVVCFKQSFLRMDSSFTEFTRTISGSQLPRETFILLVNKYLQEHALSGMVA